MIEYRCPNCHSNEVYHDAYVSMNDPDDVQTFDNKICQRCGCDFNEAEEVEVSDSDTSLADTSA